MSGSVKGTRLSEDQKRITICPKCHAGVGQPCRAVTKTGIRLPRTMLVSHEERKRMAAWKLSRQRATA